MTTASNTRSTAPTPLPELFDRYYVRFWEPELTNRLDRELELITQLGYLEPGDRVLDLACGYGRMSNALSRAGFEVTGVDLSDALLEVARTGVNEAGRDPRYLRGDMRLLDEMNCLGEFDCVLLWFTSFGYFDDDENMQVLRQAYDRLVPGGRLLIETRHWDRTQRRFEPTTLRVAGDDLLIERHVYHAETGIQESRQILLVEGRRLERVGTVRRYGFPELRSLCRGVGFTSVWGYDERGEPLNPESERAILVSVK